MENPYTIGKIFSDRIFRVPDYQREYAWERQQCQDFVEDLELLSEGQEHFFGLLILHARSDGVGTMVDQGMWGLGQRTGYRKYFRPGDRLCFYAARFGVVAEATAASRSFELAQEDSPKPNLEVPYGIWLEDVRWFEDTPVPITQEVRAELSAFEGRDLSKGWAWFVQGTSKVTAEDFRLLTGRTETEE